MQASEIDAPQLDKTKIVDSMKQPTPEAQALYDKLGGDKPEVSEEFKKRFEDLPVLGPFEYDDERGGTYLGQYKDGLRHGYGKLVRFLRGIEGFVQRLGVIFRSQKKDR